MQKIFILSCGKSKLGHVSPACEMYVGDLFKKSLAYAKTQNPDAIYILSAKYGLLELDEVIEPYEMTLNSMPKAARLNWANEVLGRLASLTDLAKSEFVFLTGERYREHLVQHLNNVSTPLLSVSRRSPR